MQILRSITLCGLLLAIFLFRLDTIPSLSWDEGWTLSVARNWVERGHYGRLLEGNLAPGGLEAAVTVVMPIALSFRILDVGIWQGRVVGLLFLSATLLVIYALTTRLFSPPAANLAIAALLLMCVLPEWHPVVIARQVLGETALLFFLLTGYLFFYFSLSRSLWALPLATLFWALALLTKTQVRPFWFVSLLLPLLGAAFARRWKLTISLMIGLLSSIVIALILHWLCNRFLIPLPSAKITGLYDVTALVMETLSRKLAAVVLLFLLPTVLGLIYESRQMLISSSWNGKGSSEAILRFMLWSFVVSWLAWYLLLSNGVLRYAFPVMFVGSIFLGNFLRDLADHRVVWRRGVISPKKGVLSQAFLAKAFIAMSSAATITMVTSYYLKPPDRALEKVVHFVQTQTPPGALIETYESEIHFLTDRRYHYPPDQIHVDAMRRTLPSVEYFPLAYDPLSANPDYLIVGPMTKGWNLYGPVLQTGAFRLRESLNRYEIYERVR